MTKYSRRKVVKRLLRDGWIEIKGKGKGSHQKFKKQGENMITIPHGDIYPKTYHSIAKSAHWK